MRPRTAFPLLMLACGLAGVTTGKALAISNDVRKRLAGHSMILKWIDHRLVSDAVHPQRWTMQASQMKL